MVEALRTVIIAVVACIFPLIVLGGAVAWVMYRNRQRQGASRAIGNALGLLPTVKNKQMQWYEGRLANGRYCAYIPIVFPRRTHRMDGQSRTAYDSAARIVMEVKREQTLDVNAMRFHVWSERKRPFSLFEDAFNAENGSKLTGEEQNALMDFAKAHPGTLWLSDREGASKDVFNDDTIMAQVTSFLLHEYEVKNPTPSEIEELVAKLSRLASLFDEV
ncbi:MAG: hypothetical protein AAF490_15915 [Chloroflexota bacterium]